MKVRRLRLALGMAIAPVLAGGPPAVGQEQFELDETDDWVLRDSPEPGSPAGSLHVARRALAAGRARRAEFLATQWIDRHDQDPLLPEAYVLRGDALRAQDEFYKALFDYEFVARGFPGSEAFVTALERELEIAQLFARGKKRKMWGMRLVDASDEAEELLIRIQERLPGSRLAEQAGMELGDFYFRRRRMALAAEMYALFIENYPRSEQITKARKRLIYAHLASFKGPEFDASGLVEAQTRLRALLATDPVTAERIGATALLTRIDDSQARKLLTTARWYLRTGDPIAAELSIRRLVLRYPRTVAAADALRLVPEILPRLPASVRAEAPDYASMLAAPTPPPGDSTGEAPPAPGAPPAPASTEESAR